MTLQYSYITILLFLIVSIGYITNGLPLSVDTEEEARFTSSKCHAFSSRLPRITASQLKRGRKQLTESVHTRLSFSIPQYNLHIVL